MFSVTCGRSCFLSIVLGYFSLCCFIFYNRYSYFYLLYLISKGIFHLGGYMSFTEWECFCFSSFTEYNLGLWIFNAYSKYFITECDCLNSAVKRTCVLEHLHRKSISGALICNTTSSGTFLHMFWECPVVIDLWTHVNLVLSSSLQTDCFANPSLCLLNDDSGLFISLIQKRRLFVGFAAAKRTMIQNWYTPHGIGTGIDWTFNIWSMCLLFCLFVLSGCYVVCEKK